MRWKVYELVPYAIQQFFCFRPQNERIKNYLRLLFDFIQSVKILKILKGILRQ